MRSLFSTLLIAFLAIFATSCEKPNNGNNTGSFQFGEPTVTASSIEVSVTPSDLEANYTTAIFETSAISGKDDATIIDEVLSSSNLRTRKGVQLVGANGLKPSTQYTVIAFYITDTDKVARYEVATEASAEPVPSEQFDVTINVDNITANSAVATATPNTNANRYYFRVITKMELDAFGIYNDDYQIFEYIIENPNSGNYVTSGPVTLNCSLNPEMDYLAVAFNFENWEAVHNQQEPIKLFRYAFKTLESEPVDPNTLFTYSNLSVTHSDFRLDVTPTKGEDSFWAYYIWTKKSYEDTLKTEPKVNIVMRSYFGLNNLGREQGIDFGEFITEYMGQTGSSQILAYEPLKNDTEYVVVMFYMDPAVVDPTVVYDYNYVAVEFKTLAPSDGAAASLEVSEPVIEADGFKYNVNFLVKTNDNATAIKVGAQPYNNYDFDKYWDPNDWSQIQAFFLYRVPVSAETLEAAKSAEGATISFTGYDKEDYVFFFEALNSENTPTQYAVRVTPDMF